MLGGVFFSFIYSIVEVWWGFLCCRILFGLKKKVIVIICNDVNEFWGYKIS